MDLESEYNNRQRVPDYAEIAQRWAAASAEVRAELDAVADGTKFRGLLQDAHAAALPPKRQSDR